MPDGPFTLAVDCGGSGLKASVLDVAGTMHAPRTRVPTPYPLSPDRLVQEIALLAAGLPRADRVTVGMPGMIRHGVVVATPH
jgi:polyphosphate glucokinase